MDGQRKQQTEVQRKADLEMKIRHRVSCEARAFDIVNRLLENSISEDYLKEACQYISRSHYEDVVEERAIAYVCGYPLCDSPLKNIPKKKYHISTKSNKVYDITERKNFCSNQCYKASKHLQKQVPDTPVWGRENEPRVNYDLLPTLGTRGEMGEEVIGGNPEYLKDEVLALERLDRHTEQAPVSTAVKKKSTKETSRQTHGSAAPMQQRLVVQHVSTSSGEQNKNLSEKMAELSVQQQSSDQVLVVEKGRSDTSVDLVVEKSSDAADVGLIAEKPSSIASDSGTCVSLAVGKANSAADVKSVVRKSNSDVDIFYNSSDMSGNSSMLESSMKKLALTENSSQKDDDVHKSDVDSDDDEVKEGEGHGEGKVTEETSIFLTELSQSASKPRENVRPCSAGVASTQKSRRYFRPWSAKPGRSVDEQTLVPSSDAEVESVKSVVRGSDSDTEQFKVGKQLATEKQSEELKAALLQSAESTAALQISEDFAQPTEFTSALPLPGEAAQPRESSAALQQPVELAQPRESTSTFKPPGQSVPPEESAGGLQQLPGESKTAYLMRLLDRRRDLLATMADIQPASQADSSPPGSEADRKPRSSHSDNFDKGSVSQSVAASSSRLREETVNTEADQSHPETQNLPAQKAGEVKISPLEAVCKIVQQWVTPETLTYLCIRPSEEEGQGHSSFSSKFQSDPEMQRKYQNLCQRLAGQERDFDEVLGEEELGNEVEGARRRPVPQFEELAQQTAEYQLRVTEFLRGPALQKKKEKQVCS